MSNEEKKAKTLVYGGAATVVLGISYFIGAMHGEISMGTRGVNEACNFMRNDSPAKVIHIDRRWAKDEMYIELGDGSKIYRGTLNTDNGGVVRVNDDAPGYSVEGNLEGVVIQEE